MMDMVRINKYRNRLLIEPGMLCALDKENQLNQPISGIKNVEVIKLVSTSGKLIKHNIWLVRVMDENSLPKEFEVSDKFLTPIGAVLIRNPDDLPSFNTIDIDILSKAENIIENYCLNCSDSKDKSTMNKKEINRLLGLLDKIKFIVSLQDV